MFTGIVLDVGRIVSSTKKSHSLSLMIETALPLERLRPGDSVACNGCCLTVCHATDHPPQNMGISKTAGKNYFECDVGPETLALTRFGTLPVGARINLEPALRMGDALGGHQVSGHIDALCEVVAFEPWQNGFYKLQICVEAPYTKYLILKGSLAVAGISFTIARLQDIEGNKKIAEIMVIPHTLEKTNLGDLALSTNREGFLEIEFDSMVKTVSSVIESMMPLRT